MGPPSAGKQAIRRRHATLASSRRRAPRAERGAPLPPPVPFSAPFLLPPWARVRAASGGRCARAALCKGFSGRLRFCCASLTRGAARSARLARARRQGSRADAESSEAGACGCCATPEIRIQGRPGARRAHPPRCRLCCPQEKKKKPKGRAYKRLQVRPRRISLQDGRQP